MSFFFGLSYIFFYYSSLFIYRDSDLINSVCFEQQNSENIVILSEDERENTIEEQIVCFFDEPVIEFLPNHDINAIIMESNTDVVESITDTIESIPENVELNPDPVELNTDVDSNTDVVESNPSVVETNTEFDSNIIESNSVVESNTDIETTVETNPIDDENIEEKTCNITTLTDIQISDSDFSENYNKTILETSLDDDKNSKNDDTESITECSTPVKKQTAVLGKEQIKKRLQSFSLLKQGINATPIKKIIKQPKVNLRVIDDCRYDENGMKIDEKIVIKKPSKRGKYIKTFTKLNIQKFFLYSRP